MMEKTHRLSPTFSIEQLIERLALQRALNLSVQLACVTGEQVV